MPQPVALQKQLPTKKTHIKYQVSKLDEGYILLEKTTLKPKAFDYKKLLFFIARYWHVITVTLKILRWGVSFIKNYFIVRKVVAKWLITTELNYIKYETFSVFFTFSLLIKYWHLGILKRILFKLNFKYFFIALYNLNFRIRVILCLPLQKLNLIYIYLKKSLFYNISRSSKIFYLVICY